MTKKEEITVKWKLAEKPTAENLSQLLKDGILTKDEVRKIVIEDSVVTQSDIEAIKSEMSLMRDLIVDLSSRNYSPQIIKIIERERQDWKPHWGWNQPYITLCSSLASGNGVNLLANK